MNVREHYEKSEQFIGIVMNGELLYTPEMRLRLAVVAQTHATLALAAAHGADQPSFEDVLPPAVDR